MQQEARMTTVITGFTTGSDSSTSRKKIKKEYVLAHLHVVRRKDNVVASVKKIIIGSDTSNDIESSYPYKIFKSNTATTATSTTTNINNNKADRVCQSHRIIRCQYERIQSHLILMICFIIVLIQQQQQQQQICVHSFILNNNNWKTLPRNIITSMDTKTNTNGDGGDGCCIMMLHTTGTNQSVSSSITTESSPVDLDDNVVLSSSSNDRTTNDQSKKYIYNQQQNETKLSSQFNNTVITSSSSFSSFSSSSSQHTTDRCNYKNNQTKIMITTTNNNNKQQQQQRQQMNRFRIRQQFQTAKELERKGQWKKASTTFRNILTIDPKDAHSYLALAKLEAKRERKSSSITYNNDSIHDNNDNSNINVNINNNNNNNNNNNDCFASQIFANGTKECPDSIHLWQAWAIYEESRGNITIAKILFEEARKLDPYNPYVCHAYGLMLRRYEIETYGSSYCTEARTLWEHSLQKYSTAALVCSLGEMLTCNKEYENARELYNTHITKLNTEKEQTEVYLAMAWLEERYYSNFDRAEELLEKSLLLSPTSSVAQVAIARFKGRRQERLDSLVRSVDNNRGGIRSSSSIVEKITTSATATAATAPETAITSTSITSTSKGERLRTAMARSLASACLRIESEGTDKQPTDGRIYNAWANLEVKVNRFKDARKILMRGLRRYPSDHSLLQAAGKIEERLGNYTGARDLYRASLQVEPSAPALVAYALLELRWPQSTISTSTSASTASTASTTNSTTNTTATTTTNGSSLDFEYISKLFEEALMVDPRHGPAYNAYARFVLERLHDEYKARTIYERGVRANCTDAASTYHGYAKMEISLGNIVRARQILLEGQDIVHRLDIRMDSPHRERSLFLSHTLGMLELNSHRPAEALRVFLDGIDRYGNSSQLLLGAALCHVRLGREQTAREFFERSVLNDEKHAQAWKAWGVMEVRAGNFDTARKIFECGITVAPYHGALWQAYGTMQWKVGDTEHARSLFERGVRMTPKNAQLYQSWASMELSVENIQPARALIARALTLDKRNGYGWLVSAEIEDRAGNTGLGTLLLRRGIECCPNNARLYCALGDVLVRQGKINEARVVMEEGLEVDPMHAPLYHSLAELEAKVFNIAGLAKLNKRASSIFNANKLEPTPALNAEMWGSNIKARRSRDIPERVAALAPRIVVDDDTTVEANNNVMYTDIDTFLEEVMASSSNLLEDGLVDELFSVQAEEFKQQAECNSTSSR